ncbi:tyrosine-type recombinase/integrase [Panacibacter sp. DH6]|uniref:Tyrosine-type recombinase/integrase n=1 Tax=Panacibacter microcysteis TaxID=2793269 RepID=A0A931GZV8_9BACT|nr:tyrosine-type recombinase/integrase [Panacibacter microcysteis]MBG9378409.1 tyrosine-type recombinase/integrase [Panacibacter microcysteis]
MSISHSLISYEGEKRILVSFPPNRHLNGRMNMVPGARWSHTLKGWHIPDTTDNRKKCKLAATDITTTETSVSTQQTVLPVQNSSNNQEEMQKFLQCLTLKAYSKSTIKTYRNEFAQLLHLLKDKPVQDLAPHHLQKYFLYCLKQGMKENTLHSRMNALKFYYEQVLHRHTMFFDIPRPKKPLQLPKVLNEDELAGMFRALPNLKHKALLFTVYSAGLRVSELVNLKLRHIDSGRMQILIENAKGKKDRYVPLSPVLLDILRSYIKQYKTKPKMYLFESEQTGEPYPTRTVQKIFQMAKHKAGISKHAGIHVLRHSFATHLLEKGIDIKYIKDLLGHFNIKTTERYLHVRKDKLINIVSPLDDLWQKGKIAW